MFACVLFDYETEMIYAGHDPIGVRSLYFGFTKGNTLGFASEMKGLHGICEHVEPFPPGSYLTYKIGEPSFILKPWFNLDFKREIYNLFDEAHAK